VEVCSFVLDCSNQHGIFVKLAAPEVIWMQPLRESFMRSENIECAQVRQLFNLYCKFIRV
jgi:hypothetical protein